MPSLSTLLCPLLTADVIAKLKQQRLKTVADYVHCDLVSLSQSTGLPYRLLTSIRTWLLAQHASLPTSAADLWQEMGTTSALLPTGCTNLDQLLDGGLMTGELTELTGAPATGKTQLCHSVAAAVVLETSSTVLWVDSTGGFSASRLQQNVIRGGASEEAIPGLLERIQVHHIFHLFDLLSLLESVSRNIVSQSDWLHSNLHLLLLDSITPLLSPLLGGHQVQGHALLSHLASQLRQLAYEHSVAVVYTNNMVTAPGSAGGLKPALGQTWSYVPHSRVTLSLAPHLATRGGMVDLHLEEKPAEKVATLSKSSRMPTGVSTCFHITQRGLESASATLHTARP